MTGPVPTPSLLMARPVPSMTKSSSPMMAFPKAPPILISPQERRKGPDFIHGIYFPIATAPNWKTLVFLLVSTGDGVATIALLFVLILIVYTICGSPLKTHEVDKRMEREGMWMAHAERFAVRGMDGRMRTTGAHIYIPTTDDDDDDPEKNHRVTIPIPMETITVTLSADPSDPHPETTPVLVVGNPKTATLSIVTHHDIVANARHGLLPFSRELLSELAQKTTTNSTTTNDNPSMDTMLPQPMKCVGNLGLHTSTWASAEDVCFYHISAPGHLEGDQVADDYKDSSSNLWHMDALAARMNKIVSCLELHGRCVYLGEGAGANICLRAAAETVQRRRHKNNDVSSISSHIFVSGLILISSECSAPTIGTMLTSSIASALFTRNVDITIPLRFLGIPSSSDDDERSGSPYMNVLRSLDRTCVAAFAKAYYTADRRPRLSKTKRILALHNLPNLVLCPGRSYDSKDRATEVCDILDTSRGSGVVEVRSSAKSQIGNRYVVGGGALLSDPQGRRACVDVCKLFLEAV